MNIVVDFLGLFALTVLEQLHSQPVVENGVGEYQIEKLIEYFRDHGPVLGRIDADARVLQRVSVPRQVLDVAQPHLHEKIAALSGTLRALMRLAYNVLESCR